MQTNEVNFFVHYLVNIMAPARPESWSEYPLEHMICSILVMTDETHPMQAPRKMKMMMKALLEKMVLTLRTHSATLLALGITAALGLGGRGG